MGGFHDPEYAMRQSVGQLARRVADLERRLKVLEAPPEDGSPTPPDGPREGGSIAAEPQQNTTLPPEGEREKIARSDDGQLIQQVRDLLAKVMRHDDLATIGMVTASEGWLEPPAHQYWKVSARVTPKLESVKPYGTTLALTQNPHVAGLLCILSTGLPRLLDLAADAILSREQESGR
jgi:hypothetical protein